MPLIVSVADRPHEMGFGTLRERYAFPDDGIASSREPDPVPRKDIRDIAIAVPSRDPQRLGGWSAPTHSECMVRPTSDAHIPPPQFGIDPATTGYPWFGRPDDYWAHFAPLSYAGED